MCVQVVARRVQQQLVAFRSAVAFGERLVDVRGARKVAALLELRGALDRGRRSCARASRSGTFLVSGLPPGEYFIVAVSDAVAGNWQEPAFLQRLARIATRFTLTPGQNLTQTLSTAEGVVR
jgi:hypothetical protein